MLHTTLRHAGHAFAAMLLPIISSLPPLLLFAIRHTPYA